MLTNNWRTLYALMLRDDATKKVIKNSAGVEINTQRSWESDYAMNTLSFYGLNNPIFTTSGNGTGWVIFGNGTTPPSVEDYFLSGSQYTSLVASAATSIVENSDGTISKQAIYTITNNSSEDVVISEMAYMGYCHRSSSSCEQAMYDHTLLDEPVTIPAGGVGQVTYTITFNIA